MSLSLNRFRATPDLDSRHGGREWRCVAGSAWNANGRASRRAAQRRKHEKH